MLSTSAKQDHRVGAAFAFLWVCALKFVCVNTLFKRQDVRAAIQESSEYRCTGISLIIGVGVVYIQSLFGVLPDLSPAGWILVISVGVIGQFLLLAFFFSNFIGKSALRAAQKKVGK